MKIVILAAGEGSRLKPLTDEKPKVLVKLFGKTLLEHHVETFGDLASEIIVVAKYKKELVEDEIKRLSEKNNIKMKIIVQGEKPGTAVAIQELDIKGDFVLINGDTIFSKRDVAKIINNNGYGALVKKVDNPEKYGIFIREGTDVVEIVEKPKKYIGNMANMGVYKFNEKIIKFANEIKISKRKEYEITDAINLFLKGEKFELIESEDDFIDITHPWDILKANEHFLGTTDGFIIEGTIEEGTHIKGKLKLGKNSIVKAGAYIEGNVIIGENCVIGPNCFIRGATIIGNNSKVGNAVEIKNSTIGDNTNVSHLSYIGDSILGDNVNIGAGTIVANLRHDKSNIKVFVNCELIDTGRKKLGVVIGDNAKIGIQTCFYPGRMIPANATTLPKEIVK